MKKVLAIVAALIISLGAYAQIVAPVKWSYAAKRTSATEATVFIKASITGGWHIYSQTVKEGGPIKTSFTFAKSPEYTLVGKTIEPKPITKYEKVFSMDVAYFQDEVVFQQKVKLKSADVTTVKGSLTYMTCNDKTCLPPDDVNFTIPIGK